MNLKINLISALFFTSYLSTIHGMENVYPAQEIKRLIENAGQANESVIVPEKGHWALLKEKIEDLKKQGFNSEVLQTFELILQDDLLAKDRVDYLAQQGESTMQFLQGIPSLFESKNHSPSPEAMAPRDNIPSFQFNLPEEMKREIWKWLVPQDKAALLFVNKEWSKFARQYFTKSPVSYDLQRQINLDYPKSFDFQPQWNVYYTLNLKNALIQTFLDSNPYKTIAYHLLFLKKRIFKVDITAGRGGLSCSNLVKVLNQYTMLNVVDLFNMELENLDLFIEFLKTNTTVTSLKLRNNKIGDEGAKALGGALEVNKTLTYLDLRDNEIEIDGAQTLGKALKSNTGLKSLHLIWNKIGDEGAKALGGALEVNKTLTYLDLRDNEVKAAGTQILGEALKSNITLISLDLGFNTIGTGAQALVSALTVNKTLTFLDLRGTEIGNAMKTALQEIMKEHSSLKTLYI